MKKREIEKTLEVLMEGIRNLEREIGILKCKEHEWVETHNDFWFMGNEEVRCKKCGKIEVWSNEDLHKYKLEQAKREVERLSYIETDIEETVTETESK